MPITGSRSIHISLTPPYLPPNKNGRNNFEKAFAKKRDSQEKTKIQNKPIFPLTVSKPLLARTAIAVFGLGFIDAGYSGDWSRIGVITPQSEEVLKIAAFAVVPLCVFLIFSFPNEPNS
ncbi:putative transmembrane protein [Senna tora]|uniref:Putative transmembrane protein n=1 Tax=Senna tora TaxID=362788 RepID=A0A834W5H4_9FABA|nr:putative transmembrane protein [Senna tora]